MNNLIEYSGIAEYIPENIVCYKEFDVKSIVNINKKLEKMKEIIKVKVTPFIKSYRKIKTPIGRSLEGQVLTGKKCIIEGEIKIRVDYLSDNGSNKIYYINYKQDFTVGIFINKQLIDSDILIPSIFIESINADLLNEEKVIILSTMLCNIER